MTSGQTAAEPESLLGEYDALLLDLDGVVYAGGVAIPHAVETLAAVRRRHVPVAFVTNNASRPPEAVAEYAKQTGATSILRRCDSASYKGST